MDRPGFDTVKFFHGIEVEHTPALGKQTLFVIGVQSVDEIKTHLLGCEHIYFGANQSFPKKPEIDTWRSWETMIKPFLDAGYWCTLDLDISALEEFHDGGLCEYRRFIPMISAKLPYIELLNYNAVLKIDDRDFEATNPGVWCHRVHDLMNSKHFTDWDQYTKDQVC